LQIESLTRKVIIGLATLLGNIELIEVDVLIIQQEGARDLPEVLIEPIDSPDHQISTIQMLLDLNLK
jgi:hypothetical protein